ncbi:replication restart helicase PriA [Niabella drilacis]|uniref:Replication restart protein PriA n=1 Tax=Niabella drilacis (strain DSM 25811 / CCM 8410 / CCUG 62505 / LMG 26954 / E90) TaxID=1285928 RepID=A0A1G6LN37_NIADE|nr:primosomal protein N' [Niabella drilacis]SDC44609.1 replication restart DNA helicase PriA [Niabella drilacis]
MNNELPYHPPAAMADFAEVIIPLALPLNYTWAIPEELKASAVAGCRVEVNLGKSKKYAGVIKRVHTTPPEFFEAKEIVNVLDAVPVVFESQLKLWEWMARYYMCTEGEVMAAALPAHFKLSSETILVFNEEAGDDFTELDTEAFLVAEALLLRKELKLSEVQQILESNHVYPVVNRLIQGRICYVWESLKESYSPKKETFVLLHPDYDSEAALEQLLNSDPRLQRAEKQMELLLGYLHFQKTEGIISKQALLKKTGASDTQLKGLADKGILVLEKRAVDRISVLPKDIRINFKLSVAQTAALERIRSALEEKDVCLLHGVTSSGKTEIYIHLIEEQIRKGKQVLYMLPEIALTSQTIRRLQRHFGGHIGVYHSRFSQNERVEIWNKVRDGSLKVILGARSSLFLPFQDLGMIVCDEEHDTSYKQMEPAPRYHARDAAIYFASLFSDCRVVLGSATPSFESYSNALNGKYGLVLLTERFGNIELPQIGIMDTRRYRSKEFADTILFPPLAESIGGALGRGKQVILFQNRRGYTPYQRCNTCGWVPQCKYCDVSLNYHKVYNKLVCHYCGTSYPLMVTCPSCGSHDFIQKQFGTERVEEALQELFPGARVGRMDIDAVRGKHAHDQLIQNFEQQKLDILVGTQMVVKGLDFEHVELVGIVDADGILSFADFRVNERAFQLMEQVSGRAGRKHGTGSVLIQTTQPEHPVLLRVQQHEYRALFDDELPKREQFGYPPYTRLIRLTFKNKIRDVVRDAATWFTTGLQDRYGNYITGPSEPLINKVRNQYLMELLLKLPRSTRLIEQCKKDVLYHVALLHQEKRYRSVVVIPDVDPF